jgi:hypothetical protein
MPTQPVAQRATSRPVRPTSLLAGTQAVFTRDQIIMSNGTESKAISYRILERTNDTLVIEMPENSALAQGSMAKLQ